MKGLQILLVVVLALIAAALASVYVAGRLSSGASDTTPNAGGAPAVTSYNQPTIMQLTSSAFAPNSPIPPKYTCDGQRTLNPPLAIAGVPDGAASLALIVDDPDVPKALRSDGVFDHWVLFNIPPTTAVIGEGQSPGTPGINGAGQNAYTGPCPPTEYEPSTHRYVFVLYALDTSLDLPAGASKVEVIQAMQGHILAQAQLIGTYSRK